MNEIVTKTQMNYRNYRESVSFNIFDIESRLLEITEEGKAWIIQGMADLTEAETILINHYLNENRELQIYDFDPSL